MTSLVSVPDVLARMQEIEALSARSTAPTAPAASVAAPSTTPPDQSFETQLADASQSELARPDLTDALYSSAVGSGELDDGDGSYFPGLPVAPTSALASLPSSTGTSTAGQRALAAAEAEVGTSEDPPGSNDGPRLADYRTAVAGAQPGQPWCAEFV